MSGRYSTNPAIRLVPRAGSILPIQPAHNHRIAFRNHLLGFRKKIKNVIHQLRSVRIGKNCALCLVYRPRPRAQFFPIRTSRLVNNIYKLLVQHDTNKRLSAVKEKLFKWWRLSFFWAIFRKSLLRNSSLNHYILDTIFHNHKALSSFFVDLI